MGALDGLTVVDAGLAVQGPQAAGLLRDWGADVVKVELPGIGDHSRSLPAGPDEPRSGYFAACNRGKRSMTLDLRGPAGREVFLRLTDRADVVVTNFTPGTMESWGLGYDVVAARNPGIIYAVGSMYGPLGPDAQQSGADLSGQAAGGLISATGSDGTEPTPVGALVADSIAAQTLASAVLAALVARGRTGRGQRVETSLLGSQIWAQAGEYASYLISGRVPGRANRGSPLVGGIYSLFPTADGWLAIAGVRGSDRAAFYDLVGRPDLAARFPQQQYGPDVRAVLYEELAPVFRGRPTAQWCAVLRTAGVRHAPVRDHREVAEDPGVWANGYLTRTEDGEAVVGTPVQFSDTPATPAATPPELGQHTEEVLLELGYTWADITRLADEGTI